MHNYAGALAPAQISPLSSSSASPRTFNYVGHRSSNAIPMLTQALPAIPVSDSSNTLPRDISSRFGLRLRELRRAKNMTQLRMAVDFGIDRSFISDVERGRKSISLHMLEVIALGMKVSLADLFNGL